MWISRPDGLPGVSFGAKKLGSRIKPYNYSFAKLVSYVDEKKEQCTRVQRKAIG